MKEGDTVYMPRSHVGYNDHVYHTDDDCSKLPDVPKERDISWIENHGADWRECKECAGEDTSGGPGRVPLRAVVVSGKDPGGQWEQ